MEKSLKSIAKDYGLYLGLILTLLTVTAYAVNLNLFVNIWFGMSIYFISIIFGIISTAKVKQHFNGYLNFKDSFTAYFVTILIGLVLVTLISFVIFNFIDTYAADILREKSIEKVIEVYENMNMSQDKLDVIIKKMESENLYSFKNSALTLLTNYLLPLSIIGLLVAATMKKSKPDTE